MTVNFDDFCPVGWLAIESSHPALAGHFPGFPIVPGVVLLEFVLEQIRAAPGLQKAVLASIPWVKFLEPVLPGQSILIGLETIARERIRFTCCVGRARVAEGLMVLAAAPA